MKTLQKNAIVTVIGIGGFATTTKVTVVYTGQTDLSGRSIYKENKKGARKKFTFRAFSKDTLVFEGEVPFKIDSEVTQPSTNGFTSTLMRGNACLNLVGDPATIKDYITTKNLNENFSRFDSVLIINGRKEVPLFPEVPTNRAVVERIRNAQ